jgi:hypothetical protein
VRRGGIILHEKEVDGHTVQRMLLGAVKNEMSRTACVWMSKGLIRTFQRNLKYKTLNLYLVSVLVTCCIWYPTCFPLGTDASWALVQSFRTKVRYQHERTDCPGSSVNRTVADRRLTMSGMAMDEWNKCCGTVQCSCSASRQICLTQKQNVSLLSSTARQTCCVCVCQSHT